MLNYQTIKSSAFPEIDLEGLFEHMPDIYFFIKNSEYQLVMANTANIQLLGCRTLDELCGKTVFDIFPPRIAEDMHRDDQQVIEKGQKIIDKVELVVNPMGGISWFSTTKLPIYDKKEDIIGMKGITRNISQAVGMHHIYNEFHPVIEYIHSALDRIISTKELAELVCLSESQFRRRFKSLFKQSPGEFILKLKVQEACRYLTIGDMNIAEIAENCGFNSQSFFTKRFKEITGVTPLLYRKKFS